MTKEEFIANLMAVMDDAKIRQARACKEADNFLHEQRIKSVKASWKKWRKRK